nr:MAG TPA: hypothetical protein [Caudoviricetes sp.]
MLYVLTRISLIYYALSKENPLLFVSKYVTRQLKSWRVFIWR